MKVGDRVYRESTDDHGLVVYVDEDGSPTVQWDVTVVDPAEVMLDEPMPACAVCGRRDRIRMLLGYMVHDDVWTLPPDAVAHLDCLERHIGRAITVDDLDDAPLNDIARHVCRHPRSSTTGDTTS